MKHLRWISRFVGIFAFSFICSSALAEDFTLQEALKYSSDLIHHRDEFTLASQSLIDEGVCELKDFHNSGGWIKATGANQDEPVYFTYCGGFTLSNRWYVNVESGRIYQ